MKKKKIKVLSLCDGQAGGYIALKNLGVDFEYHSIEKDESVRRLADGNFPYIVRWANDVTMVTKKMIEKCGPYDLILFGSSCQSVSPAGKQEGLKGESKVLIDCVRILKWCLEFNPEAKYLIENVKMKKKFLKQFNIIIGHEPTLINSKLVSAQARERYYWTNLKDKIPQPADMGITFKSILETDGEPVAWSKSTRYIDKNGNVSSDSTKGKPFIEQRFREDDKANTCTTGKGCGAQSSKNIILNSYTVKKELYLTAMEKDWFRILFQKGKGRYGLPQPQHTPSSIIAASNPRWPSVREAARLQTIPDWYDFKYVRVGTAYKAIGNGWCISVIEHILRCLGFGNPVSIL